MSLRIYLDDCANAKELVRLLTAAGHVVGIPADAGIAGKPDHVHFDFACRNNWVVLTKNPGDFEQLAAAASRHPAVFGVYQDNDRTRDMTYAEIVKAISNIVTAGVPIEDNFHNLNAWR